MDDRLTVLMGTAVAGTLSRPAENRLRFEYDDGYRAQSDATPLSLSMPLAITPTVPLSIAP